MDDREAMALARAEANIRTVLTRNIAELESIIADGEYAMERRGDTLRPLDLEPFRVGLANYRKALAALERGEYIDPDWLKIPEMMG